MSKHQPLGRQTYDLQSLETRRLLAVSIGSDGYTVFTPSSDSRIVYVSSSAGSDTNDGLSPTRPVKSIARAGMLIRNNAPDQILLRRGDVFYEAIRNWKASGRNAQEMMVLGAYGTGARPKVMSGTMEGFSVVGGNISPVRHVAVVGIEFTAHQYNGKNGTPYGIRFQRYGSNFLVEDCYVHGYKDNMVIGNPDAAVNAVRLRRNVIADAYSISVGHSQGLYLSSAVSDVWLEGNVFDLNGWNPAIPGATDTVFNHNVYVQTGVNNFTAVNNVFSRGSLHGLMVRSGGIVQNNLFVGNGVGLMIGGYNKSTVTGNVFLNGRDLSTTRSGVGINIEGYGGTTVMDNIIAHDKSNDPGLASGISIKWSAKTVQVNSNIFYDWRRELQNGSEGPTQIASNHFQSSLSDRTLIDHRVTTGSSVHQYKGNKYYSPRTNWYTIKDVERSVPSWKSTMGENDLTTQKMNYVDPDRDTATYARSVGAAGSYDGFIYEARKMAKGNYRAAFTADPVIGYVREGFNLAEDPSIPPVGQPPFDPGTIKPPTPGNTGGNTGGTTGTPTSPGGGATGGGTTGGGATGGTSDGGTGGTKGGTTKAPPDGALPIDYGVNPTAGRLAQPSGRTVSTNPALGVRPTFTGFAFSTKPLSSTTDDSTLALAALV
jgi:hypothetical protein